MKMLKVISFAVPKKIKKRVKSWINAHSDAKNMYCRYDLFIENVGKADRKVILVTGGTGAIGSAICYRMAVEGATVVLCGRDKNKISVVRNQILQSKPDAKIDGFVLDVTNEKEIENVVDSVVKKYGRIDVLINNAGGGPRGQSDYLYKQDTEVIDRVLNVNLRGAIFCTKYVSRQMVLQQSGKIINMSSVMGMNGQGFMSEYAASKAGIIGFTKSMALELAKYGVRVNCVSPGMVRQAVFDRGLPDCPTTKNALGYFGKTDDVASVISFLVSNEADYITGQNIVVDGGRSIGLK